MIQTKHKKAFSMITAIFVIVVMATVSALIMNITSKTIKATTQQYQKEQAQLLARSYTELAILYGIHNDRSTGNCLETISDHFGTKNTNGEYPYDIKLNITYIGNSTLLNGCNQNIQEDGSIGNLATWDDDESVNGRINNTVSLLIDTYITYKDFDDPSNRDISFHRRTIQKL
jgi:type II secretory pathway pseudopilin PulG